MFFYTPYKGGEGGGGLTNSLQCKTDYVVDLYNCGGNCHNFIVNLTFSPTDLPTIMSNFVVTCRDEHDDHDDHDHHDDHDDHDDPDTILAVLN